MKKRCLFLFVFGISMLIANLTYAQPRYVTPQEGFRELFLPLTRGIPSAPILYEMNLHELEDTFYRAICHKSIDADGWITLMNTLWWCAYDTLDVPDMSVMEDTVEKIIKADPLMVPIGIAAYDYHRYNENVFNVNGEYFDWTDSTIVDHAGRIEPFDVNPFDLSRGILQDLFSASPLVTSHPYKKVKYRLDPYFFNFGLSTLVGLPTTFTWKIDFGDGNGFITFDPSSLIIQEVNYTSGGIKTLTVQVEKDAVPIAISVSEIYIEGFDKLVPNENIKVGNVNADLFTACNSSGKLVMVVTGFDPLGTNTNEKTANNLIINSKINMLLNYGYDIAVVEFTEPHTGILALADELIEFIEHMKCRYDNDHPFVIFSSSLGGPVTRVALTKMEKTDYMTAAFANASICNPLRMHNTRLWISLDGEMDGANVPIGLQESIKGSVEVANFIEGLGKIKTGMGVMLRQVKRIKMQEKFDKAIANQTARELFSVHVDTKNGMNEYTHDPEFDTTWAEIRALNPATNGYPKYCKKVALSNGLFDGKRQVAIGNRVAQGGDTMNFLSMNTKLRYQRFNPLYLSFTTMHYAYYLAPNFATDTVSRIHVSVNKVNFKKLMKAIAASIALNSTSPFNAIYNTHVFDRTAIMNNDSHKSWDIVGGGREGHWVSELKSVPPGFNINPITLRPFKKFPGLGYTIFDINTSLDTVNGFFAATTGWPIEYFNLNSRCVATDWTLAYTKNTFDMVRTGFDTDMESEGIDSNLARTPFDVIIAGVTNANYPKTWSSTGGRPYWHRSVRTTEADNGAGDNLTMIVREIGDKYHYLDNRIVNRTEMYRCHDSIVAGSSSNPKYYYALGSPAGKYPALQSKTNQFNVVDSGFLHLISTREIILRPGFNVLDSGEMIAEIDSVPVCNLTYEEITEIMQTEFGASPLKLDALPNDELKKREGFKLYPNPAGKVVNLIGSSVNFEATFIDSHGKNINKYRGWKSIEINLENLPQGVYYFNITFDNQEQHLKFIKL